MYNERNEKFMKKLFSLFISVFMLMAFSTTAFAAESTQVANTLTLPKEHNGYVVDAQVENPKNTKAWSGSGPAAQVTDVRIVDYGYLDNFPGREGHFGVVVQVMGHGLDYAKYDGVAVNRFKYDPIILSGTLVDGWFNYYDCGKPTLGTHNFEVLMRSVNFPYTEMSTRATFTFTPKEEK